jgi:hypothetical protein
MGIPRLAACIAIACPCAFGSTGCAFFTPPMRFDAGLGTMTGRNAQAPVDDGTTELRISVHPLELDPDLAERRVDFALGYLHDSGGAEGAFGELGFAPYARYADTHDSAFRLWVGAQPRLLLASVNDGTPQEVAGFGIAGRMSGEWSWYAAVETKEGITHGTCHSGNASWPCDYKHGGGTLRGEFALGPYAEIAYDTIGPLAVQTVGVGLTLRTPALALW